MSELIEALILGIVQGLTEFLPVSSSGHLEIAKVLLKDDSFAQESLLVTVILHFATACATMVVFRKEITNILVKSVTKSGAEQRAYMAKIILSMVPAVFVGLFFNDLIESLFNKNLLLIAFMLIITGLLLLFADFKHNLSSSIGFSNSIVIGIAQAIAILPGISRSGATIASSILLGVERDKAARFSFLMVIPLIFGKMAKDVLDGNLMQNIPSLEYALVGFFSAFIVGIIACLWMIDIVKNAKLKYFAIYCFLVATLIFASQFI